MRSTIIVALFAVVVACIVCAGQASAYFDLDANLLGTAKRTVLPDGRIHLELPTKNHEPFPENVQFPKTDDGDVLDEVDKEHYITSRGTAVMAAHWEVFKLEDHVDVSKIVCHDQGDKNMRLSLFGVQPKLMEYLKNKKQSVILTANANSHVCHGDPIFRFVDSVQQFGDEVLLITSKAKYDEIFEHADINLEVKHPQLTHVDDSKELPSYDDNAADHGIYDRDDDETMNKPSTGAVKSTFGSNSVAASINRMYDVDDSEASPIFDPIDETDASVSGGAGAVDEAEMSEEERRRAIQQGWFKKAFKKVKKAVKKVVKRVTRTVRKTVGRVVSAVGKGIKRVAKAVGNLLSLTVNKKFSKSFNLAKNYYRQLAGVKFTFRFKFYCGFKFQLYIQSWKFKIFHTSVYGGFNLYGAAELPKNSKSKSATTTLYTIQGPKLTFSIGPVPVWIFVDVPILGGYSLDYSYAAKAGFSAVAYARFGVEWTSKNGFRVINDRSFKKSHSLTYHAELHATPWVAAQCRFKLYSFIVGWALSQVGMDVDLTTRNSRCNLIKINANIFMKVSAKVDMEITIKAFGIKKNIVNKHYGPKTMWQKSWQVINVCKRKKRRGLLGLAESAGLEVQQQQQQEQALLSRTADTLEVEKTTELDEDDSGKVWNTEVSCNSSYSYDFDVTGLFNNDSTVFWITISRNITVPAGYDDNGTLFPATSVVVTQSSLAYIDSTITLGMPATKAVMIAPNRTNAEELGIDWDDFQTLTQNASGDPSITAFSIPYITMTFGADDLAKLTMSSPWLCTPPNTNSITPPTVQQNSTEPSPPPEGTFFGRMFAAFGKSLFPAFIRLITDALVAVLVLVVIECLICWKGLPRWVGEHWPKQATTPRTREKVFLYISMSVGVLCFIVFIVGSNLVFSEIVGARLEQNYTEPAPKANPDPGRFLVASGVETIVWKFQGASITKRHCPQFYPCSPDCRDLCTSKTFSWTNAPWPYCPDSAIATNTGGCTKWAFDQIFNAIFAVFFITVGPLLAVYKSDTVYRRMSLMHASIMLSAMFLCLMWRRMHSFMKEVEVELFDPTTDMIYPFDLTFNEDSVKTWEGACVVFFILAGIMGLACLVEMYLFYQDTVEGRIVKYDADFGEDLETAEGGKSSYKKSEAEVLGTSFAKNVMADLDGMNVQEA